MLYAVLNSSGLGVLENFTASDALATSPIVFGALLANVKHTQFVPLSVCLTSNLGPDEVRASGCTDHPHGEIRDTRKRDQLRRRCRKAEVRPPKLRQDKEALDQVLRRRTEANILRVSVLGRALYLLSLREKC